MNVPTLKRADFARRLAEASATWSPRLPDRDLGTRPRSRPNIVVIMSDQHRKDACGCFGSLVRRRNGVSPTPNIDALAARGVAFDCAYCPSPLCAPARAAYMTGCHPHTTTALHHQPLKSEAGLGRFPGVRRGLRGLGEFFQEAGYRTASIGKVHVHGETTDGWDLGFDVRALRFYTQFPGAHYADLRGGDVNRRYRQMPPYAGQLYAEIDPQRFAGAPPDLRVRDNTLNQARLAPLVADPSEMFDHLVADGAMSFIELCHQRAEPFLIHVGFEKPHEPWSIQEPYLDLFDPASMPLPRTLDDWRTHGMYPTRRPDLHRNVSAADVQRITAAYYACAASMDDQVGRVIKRCDELGLLESTVFVYTSDHGEMLFDHGLIYKHQMFEAAVSIPLIMAGPGLSRGTRTCTAASLIDLLPTLLDCAAVPASAQAEGVSLLPALRGVAEAPNRPVFAEYHEEGSGAWPTRMAPMRMVREGTLKYIYTHGCHEELFDLAADPDECTNLAFEPALEPVLARLRRLALAEWELDQHPFFPVRITRIADGINLDWQSLGEGFIYDVWREAGDGTAERVGRGVASPFFEYKSSETGPGAGFQIVARPCLTRAYADAHGIARYGERPVLADIYPAFLPVSGLVSVPKTVGDSLSSAYQPWHGLRLGSLEWIFEGEPPRVHADTLSSQGRFLLLTPLPLTHAARLTFELAYLECERGDQPGVSIVFAYESTGDFHALHLPANGELSLQRRSRHENTVLWTDSATRLGSPATLTLEVGHAHLQLWLDQQVILDWSSSSAFASGRIGFQAPLHHCPFQLRHVRLSLWEPRRSPPGYR